MKRLFAHTLLGVSCACVLSAQDEAFLPVEEGAVRLMDTLNREKEILASVKDTESADAAIEPLKKLYEEQLELHPKVQVNELWNYIDSTEGLKPAFIAVMQQITHEYMRLEMINFYGNQKFFLVLAPRLRPAGQKADPK